MPRAIRFEPRADRFLAMHAGALLVAYEPPEAKGFEMIGDIAVIEIRGPLVQHGSPFCPWDSYDAIEERAFAAAAAKPKAAILRIDSPGGDALGCFECARAVRKAFAAAECPLYVYCDGQVASAGYALACAADAIYIPAAAEVGSIGVLKGRADVSQMNERVGIGMYFFASGARKLDGNPNLPLSKDEAAALQAKVDEFASLFFDFVAEMRPKLTAEDVRALEADLLFGKAAVTRGLADGVLEWSELLAMVAGGKQMASGAPEAKETDMDRKEMRAFLSEVADGKDEDKAKKAKAALKCMDDEDGEGDKKKKEDDEAKKAAADEEKEKASAKAAADEEDKKKKDDEAKAQALAGDPTATVFKALAEVQKLTAQINADRELAERTTLLASRTDFSAEMKLSLAKMPIAYVREAVSTWPKAAGFPASEASVQGTQGKRPDGATEALAPDQARALARMGGATKNEGVHAANGGFSVVFGAMSQEEARKRVEELSKKEGA